MRGDDANGIIDRLKKRLFDVNILHQNKQKTGADVDTPYGRRLYLSAEEKRKNVNTLEPMEKKVYLLLLEGFTVRETAKKLETEVSSVNDYQWEIFKKLSVNTNAELIMNYHEVEVQK